MSEPQAKMPEEQEEEFDFAKTMGELTEHYAQEVAKDRRDRAELALATAELDYVMSLESTDLSTYPPPHVCDYPPRDIFAHVCDYLTPDEHITVTHVCQHWRDLALEDTLLWNHIVQNFPDTTRVQELLERSRNTPVYLELTVFESNATSVADYLTHHLHHVKTLILRLSDGGTGRHALESWTTISDGLAHAAPVLETLYINMLRSPYRSKTEAFCSLRADFLAGNAPELRTVSLTGLAPPTDGHTIAPFGHVITLTYAHNSANAFDGTNCVELLQNFPSLETLALAAPRFFEDGTEPIELPNLRVIDTIGIAQGLEACLRTIGDENVDLVAVRLHPRSHGDATLPIVLQNTQVEKLSATLSEVAVTARDENNNLHERRFFSLGIEAIKSLLDGPDVFQFLQTLLIHEFMWPQSGTFPPAPGLRELTVLLPTVAEHRSWAMGNNHHHPMMGGGIGMAMNANDELQGMITLFQLPTQLPTPWNCVSLREFRLLYGTWARAEALIERHEQKTRTISATDLLEFLQTHLAIALPLGRIELQGVELYEAVHEIPALCGLQANCAEFVVSPPGSDPTPQQTGLWDTYYTRARMPARRRRA